MPPVCSHRAPFFGPRIASQSKSPSLVWRNCSVAPVGAAYRSPHSKTAFGKVETIAHRAADAVVRHPANQRSIHAALQDQILHQPADWVIGKRGDDRGAHAEAAAQPARHVVFSPALPGLKLPHGVDPAFARIETQHHLA